MIDILLWALLVLSIFSWVAGCAFLLMTQGSKAWRYIAIFPVFVAVIIARYPAAVIAVILWSSPDRKSLTRWRWLETIDNGLDGDTGWQLEHLAAGQDALSTWNRIRWLWRNGGNRFNYEVIGCSSNDRPAWAWTYRKSIPLFSLWFIDVFLGWSPDGKFGRSKYVFTMRPKTKP